jgi:transcriptional regulator with PAS, ATPase and Fis domain
LERKLAERIARSQAIYTFDKIIGSSRSIVGIIEYSKKISDSKSTVLISGESGTGKEIFAQAIHNFSSHKDMPFVAVNCGAIPNTLIESELFGYEEGAFTGAKKGGNLGKFQLATGGTIFLDEIGEMPLEMQIKLLRVIEEGVITKIGGNNQIAIDIRIIAATHKDLKLQIEKGCFRRDLYYRLNVIPIALPPLRERKEDIPLLVDFYVKKISRKLNKNTVHIPESYMRYLQGYSWPGNIRELENIIELIINTGDLYLDLHSVENKSINYTDKEENFLTLEEVEKAHIMNVLEKVRGNITLAAKILDVGRNTLYRKIEKYCINCSTMEHSSIMEQEKVL